MQSTQLTCPHCGSSLNFGSAIAAGTAVECLICMQTFAAESTGSASVTSPVSFEPAPTLSDAAVSVTIATKPAPLPVAKPYGVPVGAIAERPLPKAATIAAEKPDKALSIRRAKAEAVGNKLALYLATFSLLFVLTGGIAFAVWKATSASRMTVSPKTDPLNGEDPDGKDKYAEGSAGTPKLSDEDEAELRDKLREEVKLVLKRRNVTKPGGTEADLESISTFNVTKQGITGLDQEKINRAIDKGVAYLKKTQQPSGTWNHSHGVGHAAIGGLTLLECQVPANDPAVQRAVYFVRTNYANLNHTYELSLAVLFLDRLGDARDRPAIQAMALRLVAGQNDCGGWTYSCPTPSPQEMYQMYHFLQGNRPQSPMLQNPIRGGDSPGLVVSKDSGSKPPAPPSVPLKRENLSPAVQNLPIIKNAGAVKEMGKNRHGNGDNSNTQFAILALWAARRHDVPTDLSLIASYQRFINSQHSDGGWGYHSRSPSSNTMTNVGLLGMAMGHATSPDVFTPDPEKPKEFKVKPALQDPRIQKGLQALARHIGQPSTKLGDANFPMQNLYFLWSVERVAMLYDLKTIGGKDWYGWGAQILVHNQHTDGAWLHSHYPGANASVNTCFALLFLKRSNLVQDLTNNLRLHSGIQDMEP